MPDTDLENKSHFGAWGHDTLIVKQIRLETVGAKTIQVQHAIGCWTLANQKNEELQIVVAQTALKILEDE